MRCIYCMVDKVYSDDSKVSEFNREHVLQQSMGVFTGQVLVLRCVCTACNTAFSKGLDLALGRDSFESFNRTWHGLQPASDFQGRGLKSVTKFESTDSTINGAMLRPIPLEERGKFALAVHPHVRFESQGDPGNIIEVRANEIPTPEELMRKGFTLPIAIQIRGDGIERTREELRAKGWSVQDTGESGVHPGRIVAGEAVFSLTPELLRAVSKTAFNFYAAVCGADAARESLCDALRNYIYVGKEPERLPIKTIEPCAISAHPRCHWIAIANVRGQMLVEVCFFAERCYRVLVREDSEINSVNGCYVFDLDTTSVTQYSHVPSRMQRGFER